MVYALVYEWAKGNPRRLNQLEEMRQECLYKWCEARDRYIGLPEKRAKGAARRIIRNHFIELHRRASAQKRAGESKLDELPDELPVTKEPVDLDLRLAIEQVLPRLPAGQRLICERLLDGKSFADIARELGIDDSKVYREAKLIEAKFRRWGLSLSG